MMPSGSSSPTSYPTKEPRITQALLIPPVMTVAFISNGSEAMMHLRSHLNWVLWGFPFSGSCPEHTGFLLSHLRFRHITAQRLKKKKKTSQEISLYSKVWDHLFLLYKDHYHLLVISSFICHTNFN